MHDLWPQQCVILWWLVHFNQFSSHGTFLNKSTLYWSRLTSAWPLTPGMFKPLVNILKMNSVALEYHFLGKWTYDEFQTLCQTVSLTKSLPYPKVCWPYHLAKLKLNASHSSLVSGYSYSYDVPVVLPWFKSKSSTLTVMTIQLCIKCHIFFCLFVCWVFHNCCC